MRTLISFLGKNQAGYRQTCYRFDEHFARSTPFFGLALHEYLKPDRLVLVGTPGSMWDVFFEPEGCTDEALLALMDAASHGRVTPELLAQPAQQLGQRLGAKVECLLIGYAKTEVEQADLLHRLAEVVRPGERVSLDITHNLRHLPMLALVAARYLGKVRQVVVEDIYYGAFEMKPMGSEEAPVVRLKGLLTMLDWVDALASYEKDGDYGAFAELLAQDGLAKDKALALQQAAFFERTNNTVEAVKKLSTTFAAVETHPGVMGRLFKHRLAQRMNWFRQQARHGRELALAEAYLERSDYLRTATLLQEAWISQRLAKDPQAQRDFLQREQARKAGQQENWDFQELGWLRNAMAHGIKPNAANGSTTRLLQDEAKLRERLQEIRERLFA